MKRLIQKSLLAIPVLVLGLSVLLGSVARAAGTASVYLSPASGNFTVGDTITVNIYEDSGTDPNGCNETPTTSQPSQCVNAVQANLSYNPSLLTFSTISSSAAFGITPPSTGGGGTVQIGRGASSPVSGAQIVATVKFTASAAGSATVSFTGGTAVVRSSDNGSDSLTTTDGTYTIAAPVTPPAPTPPPASPGNPPAAPTPPPASPKTPPPAAKPGTPPASPSTPPSSPTASPTANPTPNLSPSVGGASVPSDVVVSNLTDKTATISWKTSVPTTSEVDYGLNSQYGVTAVDSKLVTNHSVVLSSKILIASSSFHYMVKGVDASGNPFASSDKTFATLKAGGAKKSSSSGAIIVAVAVLGLLAAGGGSFWWVKNGGSRPQWSGFEPAAQPEPINNSAAPVGQIVKPAGSTGEVKPGENVIKPGSGPNPPA